MSRFYEDVRIDEEWDLSSGTAHKAVKLSIHDQSCLLSPAETRSIADALDSKATAKLKTLQ